MLIKTLEFLRVSDIQPTDEKVRKRLEATKEVFGIIQGEANRQVLLECVQGVVVGFVGPVFVHNSPTVSAIYEAIKTRDLTFPSDLTENANELRVVAGIALGELLVAGADHPSHQAVLASLAISSALTFRPEVSDKHIRWMLETLQTASSKVIRSAADRKRRRQSVALEQLEEFDKPEEDSDLWDEVGPLIKSALQEARDRESINREELETLWWMFGAFSEIEQKPLASLTALIAALSAGIELAERALLPPSLTSMAMVKKAAESSRKPDELGKVSLQDATAGWSEGMTKCLLQTSGDMSAKLSGYPSLFPLSWVCHRLREGIEARKMSKDAKAAIGVAINHSLTPSEWGFQAFREKILQRFLADIEVG